MLLHYAGLDDRINAGIPDYEAALKAAGVDYQLYVYEGVNHAFNNDTSEARYNKDAGRPCLVAHRRVSEGGARLAFAGLHLRLNCKSNQRVDVPRSML